MAKIPIGDVLVRALATIGELQKTIATHEEVLTKLAIKVDEMEQRLAAIEKASKQ